MTTQTLTCYNRYHEFQGRIAKRAMRDAKFLAATWPGKRRKDKTNDYSESLTEALSGVFGIQDISKKSGYGIFGGKINRI